MVLVSEDKDALCCQKCFLSFAQSYPNASYVSILSEISLRKQPCISSALCKLPDVHNCA